MEKKFSLENLPELKKRYSIKNDDYGVVIVMTFYIMSIDLEKDAAYVKVVEPMSAHIGLVLSSLLEKTFYEEVEEIVN